jgi:DNA-binding phage protein
MPGAKKKIKTYSYNSAVHLDSKVAIQAYLKEAIASHDPAFTAEAVSTVKQVDSHLATLEILANSKLAARLITLAKTIDNDVRSGRLRRTFPKKK